MATRSRDRLINDIASALERYFGEGSYNTGLLREAAEAVVELRSRHHRKDGSPDWSGRTPGYKDAMHEVYSRAHLTASERSRSQYLLSPHVRHVIDATVSPEEKESAGFQETDPKELQKDRRRAAAAVAATVLTDEKVTKLLRHARVLLKRADMPHAASELTNKELVACRAVVEDIETHTKNLRKTVDAEVKARAGA